MGMIKLRSTQARNLKKGIRRPFIRGCHNWYFRTKLDTFYFGMKALVRLMKPALLFWRNISNVSEAFRQKKLHMSENRYLKINKKRKNFMFIKFIWNIQFIVLPSTCTRTHPNYDWFFSRWIWIFFKKFSILFTLSNLQMTINGNKMIPITQGSLNTAK